MNDETEPTTAEIYRLVKENNRMLRGMRRDAFVKGILGIIWWIFILIVVPYYLYSVYLAPYVKQLNDTYQKVQGTSDAIEAKIGGLPDFSKWFGGGKAE